MVNGQAYFLHTPTITEWYRDTPTGLQQLFTIAAPVTAGPTTVIAVEVASGTPTLVDPQTVSVEAADGTRFTYRDVIAWDRTGASLVAAMDVVDGAITLNIDTAGARYPITIDPTITEDNTVTPLAEASGESLRYERRDRRRHGASSPRRSTTTSVSTAASRSVGLRRRRVVPPPTTRRGGDGINVDYYGYSVDVEGDTFVVGAPGDSLNGSDAGAVYVYTRSAPGASWGRRATSYACVTAAWDASAIPGGSRGTIR